MAQTRWFQLTPARRQLLWAALIAALIIVGIFAVYYNRAEPVFRP